MVKLIYGLPLHCKIVSVFGIRVGLLKYIRPLMHPSVRALMTFARRSLTKLPVLATVQFIRLFLRWSDLFPSTSSLSQSWW